MKKQIIILIMMMVLTINLVNALDIITGVDYTFPSEEFAYWDVVGNSSDMEGMTIEWENGNTTIYFDIRYKPDNFVLTLFNEDSEIITEHHYTRGRTRTQVVYKDNNIIKYITLPGNETEPGPEPNPIIKIEKVKETISTVPSWIWFLIVLLIILVILVIVLKMKKSPQESINDDNGDDDNGDDSDDDDEDDEDDEDEDDDSIKDEAYIKSFS